MKSPAGSEPIRVLRAIARLNVGGPSIQALTLTKRLEPLGYETTLIRGVEEPREGSMDALARELGVQPRLVRSLRRALGVRDFLALTEMTRLVREIRPDIVHTHAAKAGALGRLACMLVRDSGPQVRVHTFHGHVLSEYFSAVTAAVFTRVERELALHTTRLIAVSDEVRADLVRLRVAPTQQIAVVPLGLDLGRFCLSLEDEQRERHRVRRELGLPLQWPVVVQVARLVPIKRVDRFLRIATRLASQTEVGFVVVGDGELAEQLRRSAEAKALKERLRWTGLRTDIPALMAAADVVVLTSDNEGTPVSLIEAQAAGKPTVSCDVGGVSSVIIDGVTGYAVPVGDEAGFADRVMAVLQSDGLAGRLGQAGREHVFAHFGLDRLVRDIDRLYRELLAEASATT